MEHTEVVAATRADAVLTKFVFTKTAHAQKDVIRAMWELYAKHVSTLKPIHICFDNHHSKRSFDLC